jgi:hypothetical protein
MSKDIDLDRIVQLLGQVDLARLGKLLGMLGSAHDGEAGNAGRMATGLIRAAGMDWNDFIGAAERAAIAEEAARHLLAENGQLRTLLEQAEARGGALAIWQDAGAPVTNSKRSAAWAVDLYQRGEIYLSPKECDFLIGKVPGWRGPLRPRQQEWLQHIITRIAEQTGMAPPP